VRFVHLEGQLSKELLLGSAEIGESLGSITGDFMEFDWYFNGIIVI
jgi:hypothetical protein